MGVCVMREEYCRQRQNSGCDPACHHGISLLLAVDNRLIGVRSSCKRLRCCDSEERMKID